MVALAQVLEALIIAFAVNIIDYEEFLILYELNVLWNLSLYGFLTNSIYLLGYNLMP